MNIYAGSPGWWAQVDSNHRPRAYQARALTTWAMSPCQFSVYLVSLHHWWRWWDSNPWPPACRAGALPTELHPHLQWFVVSPFFRTWERFYPFPLSCVGIELSSRTVARKVLSPLQSLTSVFGMGTGGPSAFITPTLFFSRILNPWKLNNKSSISAFFRNLLVN